LTIFVKSSPISGQRHRGNFVVAAQPMPMTLAAINILLQFGRDFVTCQAASDKQPAELNTETLWLQRIH